jgi:hypothetical protein
MYGYPLKLQVIEVDVGVELSLWFLDAIIAVDEFERYIFAREILQFLKLD